MNNLLESLYSDVDADKASNPLNALKRIKNTPWVVDGVIPPASISWIYGAPACGKTFAVMGLGVAVSSGADWMGRKCANDYGVIHVAAEGGDDVFARQVAAELSAGKRGNFKVIQSRPSPATPEGYAELAGMLDLFCSHIGAKTVRDAEKYRSEHSDKLLTKREKDDIYQAGTYLALTSRGDALTPSEEKELAEATAYFGKRIPNWLENMLKKEQESAIDYEQELLSPRLPEPHRSALKWESETEYPHPAPQNILLIIDTYSQTSPDDSKSAVGAYRDGLRNLIEESKGRLSIIVIDHCTKSGDTYMGATAKEGDSDVMVLIERKGAHLIEFECKKMKTAPEFTTIPLELVPFTIEGATDNQGRPLTSLIVKDGAKASALVKTEGAPSETVLRLLAGAGGSLDKVALREQFNTAPENEGKSPDAKRKACTRAINTLENDGLIICTENAISLSPESDRLDVGSLV